MEGRLDALRDGVVDRPRPTYCENERELMWLDAQIHGDPENAVLWAERVVLQSEMMEQYYRGDWRAELMLSAYD